MENNKKILKSWLIFKMKNELFGINVSKVISILEMQHITELPQAPAYMKGVINLRGAVLPVISMHLKFGMNDTNNQHSVKILILEIFIDNQLIKLGAIVDSVEEVIEIEDEDIQESPTIGTKYRSEFIYGMVQKEDEFIMLLDIDNIFSFDDAIELNEVSNDNQVA